MRGWLDTVDCAPVFFEAVGHAEQPGTKFDGNDADEARHLPPFIHLMFREKGRNAMRIAVVPRFSDGPVTRCGARA